MSSGGEVIIAGAGPGHINHITVGVLKEIKKADVILYDALIGETIVAEFPQSAKQIFVGKRCGNHAYTQTMIIAAMIEHAMAGKRVLRLKGGDPAIFAHLKSELEALSELGIETKVLPGISAMLTAAAELKIPLTTRQGARHIWITDGHAKDLEESIPEMAAFDGTIIFYMGANRAALISALLMSHGMRHEMPAVLIENAGSAESCHAKGTISDFASERLARQTKGPGILMVGEALVVGELNERALTALV